MAEMEWGYMVKTDGRIPVLIKFRYGEVYTYYPEEEEPWARTPLKDSILYGSGDFVWYDEITEEEAKKYMEKIAKLRLAK